MIFINSTCSNIGMWNSTYTDICNESCSRKYSSNTKPSILISIWEECCSYASMISTIINSRISSSYKLVNSSCSNTNVNCNCLSTYSGNIGSYTTTNWISTSTRICVVRTIIILITLEG